MPAPKLGRLNSMPGARMRGSEPGNKQPSAAVSPGVFFAEGADELSNGLPSVAVIGAGYLGVRIIAELLALGSPVAVYDRSFSQLSKVKGQADLDAAVVAVLRELDALGLLRLAGMEAPRASGVWVAHPNEEPRAAQLFPTIKEAVAGADIVLEAVPDSLAVKSSVFAEAMDGAREDALLATSTLSVPLVQLKQAVAKARPLAARPRIVGLRFLAPVVFVPFVEVTLTAWQRGGEDEEDLLAWLGAWGKVAFDCDVEGAVDSKVSSDDFIVSSQRSAARLRLDKTVASRRQTSEAKLRRARRAGPDAVAKLDAADLFDFAQDTCCVCMEAAPTAKSVLCGHVVLCEKCARSIASGTKRCPICRVRFMPAIKV